MGHFVVPHHNGDGAPVAHQHAQTLRPCDGRIQQIALQHDVMLCHRLHQPFPISFYAAGETQILRSLWRFLQERFPDVVLDRQEQRDLFEFDICGENFGLDNS